MNHVKAYKKTLEQENSDLKYWIEYIRYRAKYHWTGRPTEYCAMDVENTYELIKNDLFNNSQK